MFKSKFWANASVAGSGSGSALFRELGRKEVENSKKLQSFFPRYTVPRKGMVASMKIPLRARETAADQRRPR